MDVAQDDKNMHEGRPLTPTEIRKIEVETEKLEYEVTTARAASESAVYAAEVARMELERKKREELRTLAENKYYHIYNFNSEVSDSSVTSCMNELNIWSRNDPGCSMEVVFNSPGGHVIAGMALFDFITALRAKGHHITMTCRGYAASMAGILLQAGDIRQIGPESYILIHEISFGAYGKIGEVEDEVKFVEKIQSRVLDIFASRAKEAGENGTATKPYSRADFKKNWARKDWWLTSAEALAGGVVDKIA